jgi:hypothetical protein
MTNSDFHAWKDRLHLTFPRISEELGIGVSTAKAYAANLAIPRYIERACADVEREYFEAGGWSVMHPELDLIVLADVKKVLAVEYANELGGRAIPVAEARMRARAFMKAWPRSWPIPAIHRAF